MGKLRRCELETSLTDQLFGIERKSLADQLQDSELETSKFKGPEGRVLKPEKDLSLDIEFTSPNPDKIIKGQNYNRKPIEKPTTNITKLIKEYEDFIPKARDIGDGVITGGWGTTRKFNMGEKVDVDRAKKYLAMDIAKARKSVNRLVKVPLNKNEEETYLLYNNHYRMSTNIF